MTRSNCRIAGALFLVASAQFFLGLVVSEATYPGYSLADNYISDLGVGASSSIFNSSAFLLGLLSLIGVFFLPRTVEFRGLIVLLTLMAIGAVGVGIFTSAFTLIHGVVSLMAFWFGGLAAIASYKVSKPPLSAISVILGLMILAALSLFAAGLVTTGSLTSNVRPSSDFFLGLGPGGMERMIVYPALIWLALFSGYLMTTSDNKKTGIKGG